MPTDVATLFYDLERIRGRILEEPMVHEIGRKGDYARILREVLGDAEAAPAAG